MSISKYLILSSFEDRGRGIPPPIQPSSPVYKSSLVLATGLGLLKMAVLMYRAKH